MQSKIPVYPYNAKTAQERGELDKWRESFRENCACAGGIDVLIRENFDGMHLKDGTVEKIVELYGYKRVEHVLANTVQERRGDGRFRPDNRAWAESHYIPEDEMHNYCFAARSHSAILDGFISHYRKLVKKNTGRPRINSGWRKAALGAARPRAGAPFFAPALATVNRRVGTETILLVF